MFCRQSAFRMELFLPSKIKSLVLSLYMISDAIARIVILPCVNEFTVGVLWQLVVLECGLKDSLAS